MTPKMPKHARTGVRNELSARVADGEGNIVADWEIAVKGGSCVVTVVSGVWGVCVCIIVEMCFSGFKV